MYNTKIHQKFEQLRKRRAALRNFFERMPKGAELHHHLIGSAYAEDYIEIALKQNLKLHLSNLTLLPGDTPTDNTIVSIKQWLEQSPHHYDKLIDNWSVRNYKHQRTAPPPNQHFFDSFLKFSAAYVGNEGIVLAKILKRAIADNLLYIETIAQDQKTLAAATALAQTYKFAESSPKQVLQKLKAAGIETLAGQASKNIKHWHEEALTLLEQDYQDIPEVRFQTYALRFLPPEQVFAQLVLAFEVAQQSDLVVGINFVATENHPLAIRDFQLHLQFIDFLQQQYPNVSLALHAGELALGLTPPDLMNTHMADSLEKTNPKRIGHGTSICHEVTRQQTLQQMAKKGIAIEILWTSNAFILGIEPDEHPILQYWEAGVPIVLSTDDQGILRTDLIEQFVQVAWHCPELGYSDFKKFSYNSIQFAFLEASVKQLLLKKLDQQFAAFESTF